jgi:hypothetical protein
MQIRLSGSVLIVMTLVAPQAVAQTKLAHDCEAGDQKACSQLARANVPTEMRLAAVRHLTDQAVLADLARKGTSKQVRLAAIRGLIDQDLLESIARKATDTVERGAAIDLVKSQDVLADIARQDASKWVRRRAGYRLTDEAQIQKLVAEGRRDLLPTITFGGGIGKVTIDDKPVKQSFLGTISVSPGHHALTAAFVVKEDVTWEAGSENTTTFEARLGAAYALEASVGVVTWEYLSPGTRRGRGTWKLVVNEIVSSGPDLLPQFLGR